MLVRVVSEISGNDGVCWVGLTRCLGHMLAGSETLEKICCSTGTLNTSGICTAGINTKCAKMAVKLSHY